MVKRIIDTQIIDLTEYQTVAFDGDNCRVSEDCMTYNLNPKFRFIGLSGTLKGENLRTEKNCNAFTVLILFNRRTLRHQETILCRSLVKCSQYEHTRGTDSEAKRQVSSFFQLRTKKANIVEYAARVIRNELKCLFRKHRDLSSDLTEMAVNNIPLKITGYRHSPAAQNTQEMLCKMFQFVVSNPPIFKSSIIA